MGAELRIAVVQLAPASHRDTVSFAASTCLSSVSIGTQTRSRRTLKTAPDRSDCLRGTQGTTSSQVKTESESLREREVS